jgi:hypothetical protein
VSSIHNSVWKELWRLKIPSKIKLFAWWPLHGLMPPNPSLQTATLERVDSAPFFNRPRGHSTSPFSVPTCKCPMVIFGFGSYH